MKYLKLFNQDAEYQQFKESEDYILPNVSFVESDNVVYYNPFETVKSGVIMARYNATEDNLIAFNGAQNIKSLKVNGTPIEFEPIKNETTTFDVLGENISLDVNTYAASFPESYVIKSPVTSWYFKAKDPNYIINENTYVCMLAMMDGAPIVQPIPVSEVLGYSFITNDGFTLEIADAFLAEVNMYPQNGVSIGFTLMNVDMNSGTFVFIDTEHQINVSTGGLATYSFDNEGLYDVEIELSDPIISMQFAGTPLISIEIGDSITSIGNNAFRDCSGLTGELVIPNSVTEIGDHAFYECSGLTGELVIPNSVTEIGDHAFFGCSGLTSLTVGSCVTSIGDYVFANCSSISEIVCKGNIAPQIQNTTFGTNYTHIKKYGVLKVPDNADYSSWMSSDQYYLGYHGWTYPNTPVYDLICTYNVDDVSSSTTLYSSECADFKPVMMIINDEKLDAKSSYRFNEIGQHEVIYRFLTPITEIKASQFFNCPNLISINIPDSVTSIGYQAFSYCTNLTSISIPYGVTSIGNYAFSNCKGLTSIVIPDSVTEIGGYAFRNCTNLTSIVIPDSVTKLGDYAFSVCSGLIGVTIGSGVTKIGGDTFSNCSGLTSIVVSSGNTIYDSRENCNCIIETATNRLIQGCNNSFIPDSVTYIENNAFADCSGLTSVVIPDSVTSIGNQAFADCSGLTSVVIGSGVTSIGEEAFYGCRNLTSINIPDGVTSIRYQAFLACNLTSITIPDSVTSIGDRAFYNCSILNEITCLATTAPRISSDTFRSVKQGGILKVPAGSDYSSWMSTGDYYLGKYNWTVEYI